ncbi:nucleoprotein TPR-like isoform X1 [Styela clava]
MADILVRIFNPDEVSQLPETVRKKLENELQFKENSIDSLKAEVDQMKAEHEQKYYEIEKNMIEMSTRLNSASSNCSQATGRNKELDEELKSFKSLNESLETSFAEAQGEIAALKHTHDLWKAEKMTLQHSIEKRDLEITEIKGEWKAVSDKLAVTTLSKNKIELKLDELQNSGVTIQYNTKRLEKEKELLAIQNNQLTEELKAKSTELNSVKLQKENELVSLRSRLEVKMDECKQLATVSENLRTTNEELGKKIDDLLTKANTAEEEHRSMEEAYRNELQSQTNLAELYKASAKDEEEKANELASAVHELQKIVTKSADEKVANVLKLEESEKKSNDLSYQIELLKGELEKANDLLAVKRGQDPEKLSDEELAALCPTAAMASKFIKSGMTLTEIYSKYIDTVDELEIAKQECKKSNETMDAILEELNEKAPILKQQREDYERALSTITQLTSQTDAAVIECQHLRAEADDSARKLACMEREKKRLQVETGDLSTQIRFLLKELEESRGHNISMDQSMDETDVTSASDVISEHLLTFRSIKELQEQNQRLLKVVRELSAESEAREKETENKELKELKDSLQQANEELENLREERQKQIEFVEAIVRQRDMYRVLLAQEPKTGVPLSILASPSQATPTKQISIRDSVDRTPDSQDKTDSSSKALQVLKSEFDEYKKDVQDNNKVINEQADRLRSQISELRTDNTKLQANVNFSAEKYELLKKTFDNLRKESEMYREKNSKLSMLIQKQELNINKITNDLNCSQEEKENLKSKVENLLSEMEILRRAEERLRSENNSLQREQQGQGVLLANIQKIQQSMEKQEFEVRSELRSRLESQERELKNLRRTTNDTIQQKQTIIQMTEKQLLTTQRNLEKQQHINDTISATLRNVKSELESSKLENDSNIAKVANLEQKLARLAGEKGGNVTLLGTSDDDAIENLKDMKAKCASLENEISSLTLKLEKAQRAVQQHKEFAAATEESLKQANSANRELSEALETRLKNASEHQTTLEQKITTLEDENRQLNSKKTSLISEVDLRTADLNRQMATLQSDLDHALKREKDLQKSEQEARNQFTEQMNLIHDAQDKYQREMLLHAESVKELMQLKEKSETNSSDIEKAKISAKQAQHLLDSNKGMWEKQKKKLTDEIDEMKERNKDLTDQLSALHTQLETMSNQMVALQHKSATSSPAAKYSRLSTQQQAKSVAEDPTDKSNEQLMDIIKFLRKEKNLSEVKCSLAQSENTRMKQQLSHLQKQADEFKKSLHTERQKSQSTLAELSEHEALMKKVETLNVLTDSNRMLREEKDRIQEELKTTKAALIELKQKFRPIQQENNLFSTQITTLKSEKVILEQDVQRWQQRSQQLIQSPRRQDPEEYRKLIAEQQKLQKNVENLNKEVTDKKLEVSTLQGKIRELNQQTESLKNQNVNLTKKLETSETEIKAKQTESEEKNKTIMQIRRVGRRYKTQYEELQKKQKEMEEKHKSNEENRVQDTSTSEATLAEINAKLSALEASLLKITKEKEDTQKQLDMKTAEVEALKSQLQHANQKIAEESKSGNNGELAVENQKLMSERDEMKKQLQEKDDKSKRLLSKAKTRIEQIIKDKDEIAAVRDRLQSEETKLKEELEKLKQEVKTETDLKTELQNKVDDLQKQLTNATSQQQQQNKVTSVVGHQIHHYPGTSGMVEPRKAANIRPISTQRVSQVSPMRVTRTARVMPEPQQEAQEGSSTDSVPTRSSPHTQVAPSSSHLPASSMSSGTSTSMPTRAFVHPINPSAGRHQHVVSSMPTSSATHQIPTRSDATPLEQAVVRGNTSSTTDGQSKEVSVSSVVAMSSTNVDISESDQAIVSSSDDQPAQSEDGAQPSVPSSSCQSQTSSTTTVSESDSAPSQSSNASSSVNSSVAVSSIPVLIGRQALHPSHKRSYEDADESASAMDDSPGSSSDAQVSMAPVSKRQRSSPDQSSSAVHPITSQTASRSFGESSTRIQQAESSVAQVEVKSSTEVEAQVSSHLEDAEVRNEEDGVDTSSFTPIAVADDIQSTEVQPMPSSSSAEVIDLTSDESGDDLNVEQDQVEMYVVEDGEIIADAEGDGGQQEANNQVPTNSARPILVLQPTPPDLLRNRTPMRPAPLTPGLTAPSADDGDGIVPCTPTLPTRRHDDNYQTINSPHVPPGGPPIRFRFEDVSVPSQSVQPQTGIGTVDNTIMDFSGAGDEARSVPTTPIATITTVTHTFIESSQVPQSEVSAVSSSIMEDQEEIVDVDKDDEGDLMVPISSSVPEETGNVDNSSVSESRELASSNLQNIRGRRIRLIGARSRGRGGGASPSTSQQP